ncbi:MAG TPA: hypothetical protein PKL73_15330 [Polyangiaceae bacterium]|jgi:hypothetical protein|nr:MAG: hypothetical protein BWY17_04640 [Deltaproteobacteria bacterium ADurb.Bin207]HNS98323.1 hypothetical protein [Polyangiaceae bacterium]HNZ24099.1 hypothetical protein [Polyangiaceae bacterium]HOD23569.1 hypothetical protein [Polyangiaceae bacterium]HOE48809.1 hypothetical protein [Polyangiaceae bacterium]
MSWFTKFEEGSRTILLVAQSSASMRRRFALGAVGLLVLAGAGGYFLHKHSTQQAQAQVGSSWASLDQCLLGAPLAEGEKPSMRFRAVQLSALSQSVVEAGGEKAQWPVRCATHAHALRDGLVAISGTPVEKSLAYWVDKLAAALSATGASSADLSEIVDATWEQAGREGMARDKGQVTGPEAPLPTKALTIDDLKSHKPIVSKAPALDTLQTDVHPSAVLNLFAEDANKEHSLFCSMSPEKKVIHCEPLAAGIPASQLGMRLLGTSDDDVAPLLFAGSRGSEGVYRIVGGDKITASTALGGYVTKDVASVLTWDEGSKRILLHRKTGADEPKSVPVRLDEKLKISQPVRDVHVFWDHILVRGANRFDETWLAAACIKPGATGIEAPVDVGMLPESGANRPPTETDLPMVGCRTDKTKVVRVRGDSHDFLSFFVADKWTKPVKTSRTGGDLSCRRVEAYLTRFDSPAGAGMLESSIVVEKCSPAACQTSELTIEEMFKGTLGLAPASAPLIAQIEGKILVVWTAAERGGLRLRLAPIDALAKTPDTVLFDDLVQEGKVQKTSSIAEVRLLARASFAVLLIRTSQGLHALHIDAEGRMQLLKVES